MKNNKQYPKIYSCINKSKHANVDAWYNLYVENKDFFIPSNVLSLKFWNSFKSIEDLNNHLIKKRIHHIKSIFQQYFIHKETDDNLILFYNQYKKNKQFFSKLLSKISYIKEIVAPQTQTNELISMRIEDPIETIAIFEEAIDDDLLEVYEDDTPDPVLYTNIEKSKKCFNSFITLEKRYPKKTIIEIKENDDVFKLCCFNFCILDTKILTSYLEDRRIFACIDMNKINSESIIVFSYFKDNTNAQITDVHNWINLGLTDHKAIYLNFKNEINQLNLTDNSDEESHYFLKNNYKKILKKIYPIIIKNKYALSGFQLKNLIILFIKKTHIFNRIMKMDKQYYISLISFAYNKNDFILLDDLIKNYVYIFGVDEEIIFFFFKLDHFFFDFNCKETDFFIGSSSENDFVNYILKNNLDYRLKDDIDFTKHSELLLDVVYKIEDSHDNLALISSGVLNCFNVNNYNRKTLLHLLTSRNKNNFNNNVFDIFTEFDVSQEYDILINQCIEINYFINIHENNPNSTLFLMLIDKNWTTDDLVLDMHNKIKLSFSDADFSFFCNLYILKKLKDEDISYQLIDKLRNNFYNHYENQTFIAISRHITSRAITFSNSTEAPLLKELSLTQCIYLLNQTDNDHTIGYQDLLKYHNNIDEYTLGSIIHTHQVVFSRDDIINLYNLNPINLDVYLNVLYSQLKQGKDKEAIYVYYFFQLKYRDRQILKEMEMWLNIWNVYL
jgi:hypothetical protein